MEVVIFSYILESLYKNIRRHIPEQYYCPQDRRMKIEAERISPKSWHVSTKVHGVTSQKNVGLAYISADHIIHLR
jgi:hypothetical protein